MEINNKFNEIYKGENDYFNVINLESGKTYSYYLFIY